ncbi:hypothetical protein [Paraburkholderia phenoliruptrix]|uniref:hypothetical protein n=1 Tax=Paraburkholderia phenoliruptrix TaxID=252970 RepID=UPI001C6F5585|nr:hypothetical protein [Paraburkholderia phenoliruptrix]MBW9102910.1 hypothetical protein [Paraburkholderia phenoliruptrix]MBW9132884.1 hypothetical protein [Paraburkholderia ginsengiterrae]
MYVSVEIDADDVLRQMDTDELITEVEKRNRKTEGPSDVSVQQIFDAFYLGNEAAALALTKAYIQAITGRVLP